mmetsp:Transcript_2927/g.4416  ORF Transcript_2927/g.4416 Transcript_2927/m.4416 type:complete len:121 (-) Transcript_2927:6-368(-)
MGCTMSSSKTRKTFFLKCEAKSLVPPDGFDDTEFLLKPKEGLVLFKTQSRQTVNLGPIIVSDGNSARNRLETLRNRLGWPELSTMQVNSPAAAKNKTLFFNLKGAKSSYGEDDSEDTIDY